MDWAVGQARKNTPLIDGVQSPLERSVLEIVLAAKSPVVIVLARGLDNVRLPLLWRTALNSVLAEFASASASFVVIFASLAGFLAYLRLLDPGPALLGTSAPGTAAGEALGAWLATEKLRADQIKGVMALVLPAATLKTA